MRNPPLDVILSWPESNYVDPETRGQSLLVISIILLVLCFIALAARLWARLVILRAPGLDDVLITIAIIPTTGVVVTVILAANKYDCNRHVWDIPVADFVAIEQTAWCAQILFILGTTCTKISILLFYRRLTAGTLQRTFLWVIHANIALIVGFAVAFVLVLTVGCRPLDAYWLSILPTYTEEYSCYDIGAAVTAACIISVVTDVISVTLPCYVVMGMRMPIRQKLSLSAIFAVGIMVCIAGIVRTVYAWITTFNTYDEPWFGYVLWVWTAVEIELALICACAPALKPFFVRYLHSSGGHHSRSRITGPTPGACCYCDTRDTTEARKLTNISGGVRKGHLELGVLERQVGSIDDNGDGDGESVRGGYTSSVGSSHHLYGNQLEEGKPSRSS